MITGKNEPKILTKDISYKCKCRLMQRNVIQINVGMTTNVDVILVLVIVKIANI